MKFQQKLGCFQALQSRCSTESESCAELLTTFGNATWTVVASDWHRDRTDWKGWTLPNGEDLNGPVEALSKGAATTLASGRGVASWEWSKESTRMRFSWIFFAAFPVVQLPVLLYQSCISSP